MSTDGVLGPLWSSKLKLKKQTHAQCTRSWTGVGQGVLGGVIVIFVLLIVWSPPFCLWNMQLVRTLS